jgi:hypothetical protein
MEQPKIPHGSVMLCHLDDEASRKNGYTPTEVYDSIFWHLLFFGNIVVPAPWLLNNTNLAPLFGEMDGDDLETPLSGSAEIIGLLRAGLLIPVSLAGESRSLAEVGNSMLRANNGGSGTLSHVSDKIIARRAELVGAFACVIAPNLRPDIYQYSRRLFSSASLQHWLYESTTATTTSSRLVEVVEQAKHGGGLARSKLYELLKWNDGSVFATHATDIADTAYYLAYKENLGVALALPGPAVKVCTTLRGAGDLLLGNAESRTIKANVPSPFGSGLSMPEALHDFEKHPTRLEWLAEYRSNILTGTLDVRRDSNQTRLAVDLTRLASDYLGVASLTARRKMLKFTGEQYLGNVILSRMGFANVGLGLLSIGLDFFGHSSQPHQRASRRDFLRGVSILGAGTSVGLGIASEVGRHALERHRYSPTNALAIHPLFLLDRVFS